MRIYVITGFILMAAMQVQAQKAFLQTDRLLYAAGEHIYGVSYAGCDAQKAKDVVVQWRLVNNQDSVVKHFHTVYDGEGKVSFDCSLPYTLQGGKYRLRAYANNNQTEFRLFDLQLFILNPFTDAADLPSPHIVADTLPKIKDDSTWIKVNQTDEWIEVSFQDDAKHSNITLSVAESESLQMPSFAFSLVTAEQWNGAFTWSRKLWLNGKSELDQKGVQLPIIGMYCIEEDSIWMAKSNAEGVFTIFHDPFKGQRSFQALTHKSETRNILFNEISENREVRLANYRVGDAFISNFEDLANLRATVANYFGVHVAPDAEAYSDTLMYRLPPQKSYVISDYNKFDALHDFCRENDSPLQFNQEKEKWMPEILIPGKFAKKFNARTSAPLFLINGRISFDYSGIAKMKMADITRLDLYYDLAALRSRYNVFGSEGIVKITTPAAIDGLFEKGNRKLFNLSGVAAGPADLPNKLSGIHLAGNFPVFSPVLYFNTAVKEGSNNIKFNKGHEKGSFRIISICKDKNEKLYWREHIVYL